MGQFLLSNLDTALGKNTMDSALGLALMHAKKEEPNWEFQYLCCWCNRGNSRMFFFISLPNWQAPPASTSSFRLVRMGGAD